jgi:hypothetical protein
MKRRDFLKSILLVAGNLAFRPLRLPEALSSFPAAARLGRVVQPAIELRKKPSPDGEPLRLLAQDEVLVWGRSVIGANTGEKNQVWAETPEGYIWSAYFQPVKNEPAEVVTSLPQTSQGSGAWAQVCVPYLDLEMLHAPSAPWLRYRVKNGLPPRLYYSTVVWVDQLKSDEEGRTLYRINELYGGYGDIFWADATGLRLLDPDELTPINPQSEEKKVVVNLSYQTLHCFEGPHEVYYCKVSSGPRYRPEPESDLVWATPPGPHPIWRKLVSLHMSGGTAGGGWDLPGVAWTTLFAGNGVSIHSTYWHNNFGSPMSRGCVNAAPEDARWIFRWTMPHVPYDPGDVTVSMPGGTIVDVVEG